VSSSFRIAAVNLHVKSTTNMLLLRLANWHVFTKFGRLYSRGIHTQTATTQPFSFLSLSLPYSPLLIPSSSFNRGPEYNRAENFFGIKGARRWVLEHFGHKNQHLCKPTGRCITLYRISSDFSLPPPEILKTQRATFPLWWTPLPHINSGNEWRKWASSGSAALIAISSSIFFLCFNKWRCDQS